MIHIDFYLSYIALYFISINLFTFFLYLFDKIQAYKNNKNISRVSEIKLLFFSFIGGSIGSLFSMVLFSHKIKKFSFLWKFIIICIVQTIAIITYIFYI